VCVFIRHAATEHGDTSDAALQPPRPPPAAFDHRSALPSTRGSKLASASAPRAVARSCSNDAGEQGPNPLEAPTADELGPGIETERAQRGGFMGSGISERGRPSGAELTFSIGRMPKEARNG